MGRKPDLKVAIQNEDGTVRVVSADKFLQSKREPIGPATVQRLIDNCKKRGNRVHLQTLLLAWVTDIKTGHSRPTDAELDLLVDIIGRTLLQRMKGPRAGGQVRNAKGRDTRQRLQAEAAKIHERNPGRRLTNTAIARQLQKRSGLSIEYIRKMLSGKRKLGCIIR